MKVNLNEAPKGTENSQFDHYFGAAKTLDTPGLKTSRFWKSLSEKIGMYDYFV